MTIEVGLPTECHTPGCPKPFGHDNDPTDSCYRDHWPRFRLRHSNGDCKFDDKCWLYGTPGRLRKRRRLLRMLGIPTGYIDLEIVAVRMPSTTKEWEDLEIETQRQGY